MFSDTYITIETPSENSFKDRSSRFLGYACPVKNEAEVKAHLQRLRKKYHDATHVCHAYVLGANKKISHSSDDGEPANTAGKPMQRAIISAGLTYVAIYIVRYFGGTQLGVPGLINAYHTCAVETLKKASIVERIVEEEYMVQASYEHENEVFQLMKLYGANVLSLQKNELLNITFAIRRSKVEAFCNQLKKIASIHLTFQGNR